ncbi:MAG: 1-(5-phosphoribosyl)-5-[(5-phosphoribosylamino)methylideneamino]imidazole-4-carboxamide isomerase [Chloroflexi bacterium]|nr:1-(5-phosphoribosyl)-5-[(5-phosphoribosylamino)methylideneamino]imidazole-4-carboxamide isomerase [Chloroflexota bacterium]MCI0581014.1 1-(5-phosphoribosyl)-5-[(5-phosphoribosylamino)methylideneamino]imidazole-4-carboxamide isomerase [Chloroflexota bacterium]MCI0646353.1 1-(5-phosphoribosyl)-5-[(5-phosphoribosylamino)methylideneamino]imidazole-4-carboxamide isomerase [Chloroflexota bacterium]MCI0728389.1 1-(5-phosphoribosyl)-5-[(5-phosphoribosylamino)methylideneamino]imidazole-4-carboxamide i
MDTFTVYPAIDLRKGRVVRLVQGDPARQTVYGDDPAAVARRWLAAGANWLHVVNLDGAFGEEESANIAALRAILAAAGPGRVQFGGGLRSLADMEQTLEWGVGRVILGTAAVESPELVAEAVARFSPERVGVGIDARDNRVRVKGWVEASDLEPATLGRQLAGLGVRTVVYTNIARDGAGRGVDVAASQQLAEGTGLAVIASGGVASAADVAAVRAAGLSGVIVGRALYEGQVRLEEMLSC